MEIEPRNKNSNFYETSYNIEEIKHLLSDDIKFAQDFLNPYYLSDITTYDVYHTKLDNYFHKNKNKKPTKQDYLAYIILLTYPLEMALKFNNFEDIILFNKKLLESGKSDFILVDDLDIQEDNVTNYDCICSYQRLHTINIVKNKYTNIQIQARYEEESSL